MATLCCTLLPVVAGQMLSKRFFREQAMQKNKINVDTLHRAGYIESSWRSCNDAFGGVSGIDFNQGNVDEHTPLHYGVWNYLTDIVKILLPKQVIRTSRISTSAPPSSWLYCMVMMKSPSCFWMRQLMSMNQILGAILCYTTLPNMAGYILSEFF